MKTTVAYELSLSGVGQNFYTLWRHRITDRMVISTFIKNLSIDFDEALVKARRISGEDEEGEEYSKRLHILDSDGVNEIIRLGTSKTKAELEGILTFGKHKHEKIEDVFTSDKKYVEWIAKGGWMKDERTKDWYTTFGEDRPVRQQAIALLIGNGDWIERKGKFMAVEKAQKLDYIDSLVADSTIREGDRIKKRCLKMVGKLFLNDSEYGTRASFKMVDEHNHIYHANISGGFRPEEDVWYEVSFTANLYKDRVYMKRMKCLTEPVLLIGETLARMENELHSKKQYRSKTFTCEDQRVYELIGKLLDEKRYGAIY